MPDWREIVSKGLSGLKLGADEKEEVHAELAEHLEETYEALLREGMSESAAIRRTLSLAEDWNDLRRKIHWARKGKETMTDRMKQLWLCLGGLWFPERLFSPVRYPCCFSSLGRKIRSRRHSYPSRRSSDLGEKSLARGCLA